MNLLELVHEAAARLESGGVSFGHGTTNAFDEAAWTEISSEAHPAGEKDDHPFVFRVLERK